MLWALLFGTAALLPFASGLAQNYTLWNGTATRSVRCPTGSKIVASLTLTIDDSGQKACGLVNNQGRCVLGQSSCTMTGCAGSAGSTVSNFIWIACDTTYPADRTWVTLATSAQDAVSATCPSAYRNVFGYIIHYSNSWNPTTDTCIPPNNAGCTEGQTSCSTTFCDTAGTDAQVVHTSCQQSGNLPYHVVSATGAGNQNLMATCPVGFLSDFGFTTHWANKFASAACWPKNWRSCAANQTSCAITPCALNGGGDDMALVVVACKAVSCGVPPSVANGGYVCTDNGNGVNSFGATCTYTCNSGYQTNTTGITCQSNGKWNGTMKCVDVNECIVTPGICRAPTNCANTVGSYTCSACPVNSIGNGTVGCVYPNPCSPDPCLGHKCYPYLATFACEPYFIANTMVMGSTPGETIDNNLENVFLPSNNGGQVSMQYYLQKNPPYNLGLSFAYGPYSSPDFPCSPVSSTSVSGSQTLYNLYCTMGAGVGEHSFMMVATFNITSLTLPVTWKTTTVVIQQYITFYDYWLAVYPPPNITAGSLHIYGQPLLPLPIPKNVSAIDPTDELVFYGHHFGTNMAAIAVYYGPDINSLAFTCFVSYLTDTEIRCQTQEGATGMNLKFTVQAWTWQQAVSVDSYYYSTARPELTSVVGCTRGPLGPIGCPTAGGLSLTLYGQSFRKPVSVTVDGTSCPVDSSTLIRYPNGSSVVQCFLPEGAGLNVLVVATCDVFTTTPQYLTYAAPIITSLLGCQSVSPLQLSTCDRAGGQVMTITGSNFGTSSATVFIGNIPCFNVVHSNGTNGFGPDARVTCVLPPAIGSEDMSVVVQQSRGLPSLTNAILTYAPCPSGQFELAQVGCTLCDIGRFAALPGSVECAYCPTGTFADSPGAEECTPCDMGMFRDNDQIETLRKFQLNMADNITFENVTIEMDNVTETEILLALCQPCAQGMYANSNGTARCQRCDAGKYAGFVGSSECTLCDLGKAGGQTGMIQCINCLAGKYQALEGQCECDDCLVGYSSVADGAPCNACPSGSYQGSTGQTKCLECTPGYYQGNDGQAVCYPCQKGSFANQSFATACQDCSPGFSQSLTAMQSCDPCPLGRYQDASAQDTCLPCDPGTYSGSVGATACIVCAPGYATDDMGSTSCSPCGAGMFASANKSAICFQCDAGKYSSTGQALCTPCPGGYYQPQAEQNNCNRCEVGTFSLPGAESCLACPGSSISGVGGMSTCQECSSGALANTGHSSCICPVGQFADDNVCRNCPQGSKCTSVGVTVDTLEALPGFWRQFANNSADNTTDVPVFYPCLRTKDCLGGLHSSCGNYRTGQLCALCVPGYRMSVNECKVCPNPKNAIVYSVLLLIAAIIGIIFMFAIVIRADNNGGQLLNLKSQTNFVLRRSMKDLVGMNNQVFEGNSANVMGMAKAQLHHSPSQGGGLKISTSTNGSNLEVKVSNLENEIVDTRAKANMTFPLKSVLTFFQITTNIATVNTIPWPSYYLAFINVFSFLNIDFIPWQTISCSVQRFDFFTKLVATTCTPLAVFALIVSAYLIPTALIDHFDYSDSPEAKLKRLRHRALFWKLICFSLFLMYPLLSNTILGTFSCQKVAGVWYLVRDFNVICYTKAWYNYVTFASVMVLVYPLGVPVGFLFLLYFKRNQLYKNPTTRTSLGFFYESYVVGMWWVEAIEMLHKVTLTSVLQFLPKDVHLRFGLCVNASYIIMTLVVSPYIRKSDDRLFMATNSAIMNLLLASWVLESGGILTNQQDILLSALLIALVIVLVVAVLVQLMVFVRKLWRLQRRMYLIKQNNLSARPSHSQAAERSRSNLD